MNKTVYKTLSALLALGLLTGCSNAEDSSSNETETAQKTADRPGGTPPDKPDGEGGGPGGAPGGGFGSSTADIDYSASVEITSAADETDQTYASDTADESALLISTSEEVTITNPTVTKTGDSDGGDNCNFYGLNAAVLVKDGSVTTIEGGTVTSDADGANGVFSYGGNGGTNGAEGDGTTVIIKNTKIKTTGNGSGGIMTTGGGITKAYNGCPAIYSTADVTVENAQLTSNLSEGVCIEGKNSITLNNCDLTANNTQCNGNAQFLDSIMIYQSMSGDADSGVSSFTMSGGSLTSLSGHVFHVTNTNGVITLTDVDITNKDSENILLSVCDDGWSGAENTAKLNASDQELEGAILVGSNSTLTLNLSDGSGFTGYIDGTITNADGETVSDETGTVNVTLDSSSTWTLTADSYVTSFTGDASGIISNGYTLYVNGTPLTGTN